MDAHLALCMFFDCVLTCEGGVKTPVWLCIPGRTKKDDLGKS